jgi:hypothetical protein
LIRSIYGDVNGGNDEDGATNWRTIWNLNKGEFVNTFKQLVLYNEGENNFKQEVTNNIDRYMGGLKHDLEGLENPTDKNNLLDRLKNLCNFFDGMFENPKITIEQ